MVRRPTAMHVVTTERPYRGKVYRTHLLRRSFREDGKVTNETLATRYLLRLREVLAVVGENLRKGTQPRVGAF